MFGKIKTCSVGHFILNRLILLMSLNILILVSVATLLKPHTVMSWWYINIHQIELLELFSLSLYSYGC